MKNAITVDVEDYFQVTCFDQVVPRSRWDSMESRVERNTEKVLQIFDENSVKGTFFVLGWVAERFPDLVRTIAAHGHEIGCHSDSHRQVFRLTRDEFREDLRKSKGILERITGRKVVCFRAPSFSITQEAYWAWDILYEEGFRIDSSVYPVHHDRYGNPKAERFIHNREVLGGNGSIVEFPLMTLKVLGHNVPAAGGGYLRIFPLWIIEKALRKCKEEGRPGIIYFHPWEIDPDQPRIKTCLTSRFRHYANLRRVEPRLQRLLARFSFAPMTEVVEEFLPTSSVLKTR